MGTLEDDYGAEHRWNAEQEKKKREYEIRCAFDGPALEAARQIDGWYKTKEFKDAQRVAALQIRITDLMVAAFLAALKTAATADQPGRESK